MNPVLVVLTTSIMVIVGVSLGVWMLKDPNVSQAAIIPFAISIINFIMGLIYLYEMVNTGRKKKVLN